MEYYVMTGVTNDLEITVATFEMKGEVVDFIEEKINKFGYNLSDFKVVYGTRLLLETERVPTRIFVKSPS